MIQIQLYLLVNTFRVKRNLIDPLVYIRLRSSFRSRTWTTLQNPVQCKLGLAAYLKRCHKVYTWPCKCSLQACKQHMSAKLKMSFGAGRTCTVFGKHYSVDLNSAEQVLTTVSTLNLQL